MFKPKALIVDNVDDCDGAGLVFFPSKQSDQGPNEPHRPTEHGAPNAGSANFFAQSSVSLSAIVGIFGLKELLHVHRATSTLVMRRMMFEQRSQ